MMCRSTLRAALTAVLALVATGPALRAQTAASADVDPLAVALATGDSLWAVELDAKGSADFARAALVLDPTSRRASAMLARATWGLAILARSEPEVWRERLDDLIGMAEDGNSPAADWALRARGELSLRVGAREAARLAEFLFDESERRIAADSTDALAHGVLGRAHHEIMRLSRVERFLARTLAGGGALGRASWEAAERHLSASVRFDPDDRQARMSWARYLSVRDRPVEAAEQLRAAWAIPDQTPHDRVLRIELCRLLTDLLSWAPDGEPAPAACPVRNED